MIKVFIYYTITIFYVYAHKSYENQEHQCIHDQMDYSRVTPPDFFETYEEKYGNRHLQKANPQPIRITIDYKELDNPANGEGLTPEKRQYLVNIIEGAKIYLTRLLKVIPRTLPVKIYFGEMCYDVKASPEIIKGGSGIPNSDLHIYVTYVNDKTTNFLANAIHCSLDPNPIVGRIAFNIGLMIMDINNTQAFQDNFSTSLHEIMHILGFSGAQVSNWINPDTGNPYGTDTDKVYKQERRWDVNMVFRLFSKNVLRVARTHFNCPSINGLYLENQGGGGSMGSHWERDLLGNEFMTASIVRGVYTISEFTGALLLDTGFYAEVNSNVLMPLYWGKNKGCDFFNKACNSTTIFPEFADPNQSEGCDYFSRGLSRSQKNGTFTQCLSQIVYTNSYCEDNETFQPKELTRQNTGPGSRCFLSTAVQKGEEIYPLKGRCFKAKCAADNKSIDVNIWGDEFVNCKSPKQVIDLSQETKTTSGIMQCPQDFDLFCNFPRACPKNCSNNGVCINSSCMCLNGWSGEDCTIKCPLDKAWDGTNCVDKCPSNTFKNFDNVCKTTCGYRQYKDEIKGTCEICHTNCSVCTGPSSTECSDCNNGYNKNSTGTSCYKCDPTCFTCKGEKPTQCTSCTNERFLDFTKDCKVCADKIKNCSLCTSVDSTLTCNSCYEGYFLKSNTCQQCSSSCKNCSGSASKCTACKPDYSLNETNQTCYLCHPSCLSCSENQNEKACISCDTGKYLQDGKCLMCNSSCSYCKNTPDFCISCKQGYTFDEKLGTCTRICKQYEYQDDDGVCQKCQSPCLDCYQLQKCFSCVKGYTYQVDKQICASVCKEDEFYDSDDVCKKCQNNCSKCKSLDKCTSCILGYSFQVEQQTCKRICKDDEYYDSDQTCKKCQPLCPTCSSLSECSSCIRGYSIQSDKKTCKRICKEDEFYDSNNVCQKCSLNCSKCESLDKCASCIRGYSLQSDKKTCNRICKDNEFYDSNNVCQKCSPICATCSSLNQCLSCIRGYSFQASQQICTKICKDDQFYDSDDVCKNCQSPCSSCLSLEKCSSCIRGYKYQADQLICKRICKDEEFYDSDEVCKRCQSTCSTCTSFDKCSSCIRGYSYQSDQQSCKRICKDDEYFDNNGDCKRCQSICTTCTSLDKCQSCIRGYQYQADQLTCKRICKDEEFYDNDEICKRCQSTCSTCTSFDKCSSCIRGYSYQSDQQSCKRICKDDEYFDNNGECKRCQSICSTCTSLDKCQSCIKGYYYQADLQTCNSICKEDQFYDNDEGCKKCQSPCSTCTQLDICSSCIKGYSIQVDQQTCKRICKENEYYSNDGVCQKCQTNCATCSSLDKCSDCIKGYSLQDDQLTCKSICKDDQYFDNDGDCKKCQSPCNQCISKDKCTSCEQAYIYQSDQNICKATQCHEFCKTCLKNNDQKTCTSCRSDMFLSNGQCFSCLKDCATCNSKANNCTSCQNGLELKNGACIKPILECHKSCRTCSASPSGNKTFCESCFDGSYLSDDSCLPCKTQCKTCGVGSYICTSCDENLYVFNKSKKTCEPKPCNSICKSCKSNDSSQCQSCYEGFVLDGSLCQPCSSTCKTCSQNPNNCTSCPSGFHLKNGNCSDQSSTIKYECDKTCSQCIGSYFDQCTQCAGNRILNKKKSNLDYGFCVCPERTTDVNEPICQDSNIQSNIKSTTSATFAASAATSTVVSASTSNPIVALGIMEFSQSVSYLSYVNKKPAVGFDDTMNVISYSHTSNFINLDYLAEQDEENEKRYKDKRNLEISSNIKIDSDDSDEHRNPKFSQNKKTQLFIINALILIIINVAVWAISGILHLIKVDNDENSLFLKLRRIYNISIPIVIFTLSSQEFSLSMFYQMLNLKSYTGLQILSSILSILTLFYIISFILYLFYYLEFKKVLCGSKYQQNQIWQHRFYLIFLYVKQDNFFTRNFVQISVLRKVLISLITACVINSPKTQIALLVLCYASYLIYLIICRPFKSNLYNFMMILLDAVILVIHILYCVLFVYDGDSEKEKVISLMMLFLTLSVFFGFLVYTLITIGRICHNLFKRYKTYRNQSKVYIGSTQKDDEKAGIKLNTQLSKNIGYTSVHNIQTANQLDERYNIQSGII